MRKSVLACALAFLTGACVTATPYQPYRSHSAGGVHGGYSEVKLAPDRYSVRFHGNSLTSRERVESYMLYRSAELTVQNGYDWFDVVERNTEHNVRTIVRPNPFYQPYFGPNYSTWQPYWNVYVGGMGWRDWGYDRPGQEPYDVRRIEAFEATAEIHMHKGATPASDPHDIDARKVLGELRSTIERPKGSSSR